MIAQHVRDLNVIVVTTTRQLLKDESGSVVTNTGDSDGAEATLPVDAEVGCNFSIRIRAAQTFTLKHGQATNLFVVNGAAQTADKDISADDEAERLDVVKINSTDWLCSTIGTWTVEG